MYLAFLTGWFLLALVLDSSVGNNSAGARRGGMISMFASPEGWNTEALTLPGDRGGWILTKDAGAGARAEDAAESSLHLASAVLAVKASDEVAIGMGEGKSNMVTTKNGPIHLER